MIMINKFNSAIFEHNFRCSQRIKALIIQSIEIKKRKREEAETSVKME